ncbi:hypothetical protein QBC33DRAFT_576422 [Phialemonium atrogriseum]|uniref:Peptidase S54 rhomboid domain-containing protein n=1 Tax=Phialemonium atrogriseum TaxID=1093897 RepID=A0AAJ0C705_9PEZI|nr:uncharacterized protein QBC33DRAFT_576422 [Phialemonium atrogriseum]KAK1769882.1 hypothetical protein QBC33DRAFT_576422 [Phialemonium atrogriseum]
MTTSLNAAAFRSRLQLAIERVSRSPARSTGLSCARCYSTNQPRPVPRLSRDPFARTPLAASRRLHFPNPQIRIGVRTIFSGSVIRDYVDLPPNYRDDIGLPFRGKDLEQHEVLAAFGPGIRPAAANKLLRILHGRRVAGTLDDPAVKVNTVQFAEELQNAALAYLRQRVPVNEIANAGLRAEDELRTLEGSEEMEVEEGDKAKTPGYSSRFNIYKKEEVDETQPQDPVYGRGVLDKIRARNEALWKEELKRREEEKKKQEEEQARLNPGGLQTTDLNQPRQVSVRMQQWMEAATSDLKEPPKMRAWERLLPSTIVVALLVGGLVAYAEFYRPPQRKARLWPDVPPAAATVLALIGLNVAGFMLWKFPPLWGMMNRYFMVVAATPKPLSIIGAMFSHQKASHLFTNMLFLWFFGVRLHDEVGRGNFLAAYFASGSVGFLATLYSLVLRNQLHLTTLGASGAIYGVAAAYFWMHRFDGFKILGLPPDPSTGVQGLGFIGLMLAVNISAMFSKNHMLDIASHISGIGVGIAAGHLLEKKMNEKKQRLREERQTNLGIVDKLMEKK